MRLVVTRPQADSERTAAALRARGHEVLVAPLLRIEPVPANFSGGWGGVIVTSANAPGAVANDPACKALFKLPLFAVGRRSAEAAREAGFTDVTSAGGDVRDLVRLIAERRPDASAPWLYLAGEDRAADLVGELVMHGITAEMAVVYRAATAPFPPELTAAPRIISPARPRRAWPVRRSACGISACRRRSPRRLRRPVRAGSPSRRGRTRRR